MNGAPGVHETPSALSGDGAFLADRDEPAPFQATSFHPDAVPEQRGVQTKPSGLVRIAPSLPTATKSDPFQATRVRSAAMFGSARARAPRPC